MTDKTRIGTLTEDERNIINFLSADERKAALLIAGRKKMQLAMMTDEQREETNEQMKRDTMEVTTLSEQDPACAQGPQSWGGNTDGTQMVVWQQLDGFYGCLQGAAGGNWFEGEDQGPYPLRSDIEEVLRDDYENPEEVDSE